MASLSGPLISVAEPMVDSFNYRRRFDCRCLKDASIRARQRHLFQDFPRAVAVERLAFLPEFCPGL